MLRKRKHVVFITVFGTELDKVPYEIIYTYKRAKSNKTSLLPSVNFGGRVAREKCSQKSTRSLAAVHRRHYSERRDV